MKFDVYRKDDGNFRNFRVEVGEKLLIDRNEDFYAELSAWVDGVLCLMKNGTSCFSATSGFAPFYGVLSEGKVDFETLDGETISADFFDVVSRTIEFLYLQSNDASFLDGDCENFRRMAESLLAGFRFRFKEKYREFVSGLVEKNIIKDEIVVL